MKCEWCGNPVDPSKDTFYSVDIYRFNNGVEINFEENVLVCSDCYVGKYNVEARRRYYESIIARVIKGEELSTGQMVTVMSLMGEDYFEKND